MRAAQKSFVLIYISAILLLVGGCSGLPAGVGSSTSTAGGPFTIGVTVTGLSGTGLVLLDNGTSPLAIIAPGSFTFGTTIASSGTYDVTVKTQPSNPTQTCTVAQSSAMGTVTGNVSGIAVTCTTNPVTATIGGMVSGLVQNSSVILQNNSGDSLTITANGAFTFKTPVTGSDVYAVTVATQPASPNQICTVTGGNGVASANVTSVAVNCVLSFSIGGNVTGLVGSGLILQNSATKEQLPISAANGNQAFTFTQLVPTGTQYTVSIFSEPTGPTQNCVFNPTSSATGTASGNVISVTVVCPAVTYSVGGMVVGLAGVSPNNGVLTDNTFKIEINNGNTLNITENGPFTFATPEALNDAYSVTITHAASTQPQACTRVNPTGIVMQTVTNIVLDCAHDDWTWIDGVKTASTLSTIEYGQFPTSAPTSTPNPFTNSPGPRYGAVGWTDNSGNMWLFGGEGWELTGNPTPDTLPGEMNDLWVCVLISDYCQWQLVGGYDATVDGTTTVGAEIVANAQHEDQVGSGRAPVPSRLGAASWTDTSGNLWLFGGSESAHFRNDMWMFNASAYGGYNPDTYTGNGGKWTFESGSAGFDQFGVYPPNANPYPGARINALTWTDASGNFWMFGGLGWDGSGTLGFLNDLWEYTGGKWNFVSGTSLANQSGVYGTAGTGATGNLPGGRHEAAGWADANGNLWLFGGEGEDGNTPATANGILNDLWFYNIASKQWTYVLGNTTANQTGIYPAQTVVGPVSTTGAASTCGLSVGLTSGGNTICNSVSLAGAQPGSRWGGAAWVDAGGNFWLFGGWGLDSTGTNGNGALNDMWVYTPNTTPGQPGTWAWVKGSNTGSQNGVYGTELRPYATYYIYTPGGRNNATHWVDASGQLWLFGGEGYDSTSTTGNGYLDDMWRYLPYKN